MDKNYVSDNTINALRKRIQDVTSDIKVEQDDELISSLYLERFSYKEIMKVLLCPKKKSDSKIKVML